MAFATRELDFWLKGVGKIPGAIVIGSSVNGLSFARSLGRRGVPVLLLDSERLIGAFTRYARFILLPPVEQHPDAWLALFEFIGARLDAPGVLFVTSDAHVLFAAEHENWLRRFYRFIIPEYATVKRILNKRDQYQMAQTVGIPIPKTYFPESVEEARHVAQPLTYPCLLKPYTSHLARAQMGPRKVVIVSSPAELVSAYERLAVGDLRWMIQDIVPGDDSALYGYRGFWDEAGRERAWVITRKLRQHPPGFGNGSLTATVDAPEVVALSRRLLRAFDYRGFGSTEFKLDARDHTFRLIEINPRTVVNNHLAVLAGVDFPWIGYSHLTGRPIENGGAGRYSVGVKGVNEEWDIQSFFALYRSGALGLREWLVSLRGAKPMIAAWDDPLPIAAGVWRMLRVLSGAILSAARRFAQDRSDGNRR